MVKMIECSHGSRAPDTRITSTYYGGNLPVEQAEPGRHGCPVCAYERGREDVLDELKKVLSNKLSEILGRVG